MLKSKILPVICTAILGLLLSSVTIAADNSIHNDGGNVNLTGGTYTARIIAAKAVVYADENMLSPLGYIANGKAVVVGNPRRMNRDLVPIVIYGRLAFIEVKDIRYENSADEEYSVKRGAPREHDVDVTIQKPEEALSENNSAYLNFHTYASNDSIKNAFMTLEEETNSPFTGFQLQLIHRKELSRIFWGAAIDYSSISTSNMVFGYWILSPTFGYTPMRNKLFLIDAYGSFDIAINTEYNHSANGVKEPTGFIYGLQGNARMVFFPDAKYHIHGGVGFRKYKVAGLETLKDLNGKPFEGISEITALQIFAGVSMEFN